MTPWEIDAPDGRRFTVIAPDHVPQADVLEWAQEKAPTWRDGGRYRYPAPDAELPEADVPAPVEPRTESPAQAAPRRQVRVPAGMTKWEIDAPNGDHYTVLAPREASEDEVMGYAQASAPSWRNGGVYTLPESGDIQDFAEEQVPVPRAKLDLEALGGERMIEPTLDPRRSPKPLSTEEAERTRRELEAKMENIEIAREQLRRRMGEPDFRSGRETAGATLDTPGHRRLRELDAKYAELEAQRDHLTVGHAGELGGGIIGAVGGGLVGTALFRNPIAALALSWLGAAGGANVGTRLWDIPEARKAREISDEEAARIANSRGAYSLMFDGALMLVFGPGAQVIGRYTRNSPLGQMIAKGAQKIIGWDDIVRAGKNLRGAQRQRAVEARTKGQDSLTKEAVERMAADGEVPTRAQVTGENHLLDDAAEQIAPGARRKQREQITRNVEDRIAIARTGGAEPFGPLLHDFENKAAGDAIADIQTGVRAAIRQRTAPTFEEARTAGFRINLAGAKAFIRNALRENDGALNQVLKETERQRLQGMLNQLEADPFMGAAAAQRFISALKAGQRAIVDGTPASDLYQQTLSDVIGQTEQLFDNAAEAMSPGLRKRLQDARKLYREMSEITLDEEVEKLLRKNPEAVLEALTQRGKTTPLDAINKLINFGRVFGVESAEQNAELIRRAAFESYVRREVLSGVDSAAQFNHKWLTDAKFRRTFEKLAEIGGPSMRMQVNDLKVLSKMAEIAQRNGAKDRSWLPITIPGATGLAVGVGSGVGAGTFVGLSLYGVARALATARTSGNRGILNALRRVMDATMRPEMYGAGRAAALAEAVRQLDSWGQEQGIKLFAPLDDKDAQ